LDMGIGFWVRRVPWKHFLHIVCEFQLSALLCCIILFCLA